MEGSYDMNMRKPYSPSTLCSASCLTVAFEPEPGTRSVLHKDGHPLWPASAFLLASHKKMYCGNCGGTMMYYVALKKTLWMDGSMDPLVPGKSPGRVQRRRAPEKWRLLLRVGNHVCLCCAPLSIGCIFTGGYPRKPNAHHGKRT